MKKTYTTKLFFGDKVTLITEPEVTGIITKIILEPNGAKTYEMSVGCEKSWHNEVELEKVTEPKRVAGFGKNK